MRVSAQGPQARSTLATSAVAATPGTLETGSGIQYHQLTWNGSGTLSTCTVELDSSADSITWSGTIITGQTCTSNGQSSVSVATTANYIRINVTAISGGGTVTVTYLGYTANPVSGISPNTPGIPTYNGPLVIYAANYGVKANAIRYYDCSFVNTSKTVNCGITAVESDVPFTSAMIGWNVFGTNGSPTAGGQPNSTAILPAGTITAVNSTTQIVVSGAATAGCTSTNGVDQCQLVIALTDDTTSLRNAFNAMANATLGPGCGLLVLPQGNMWISGPIQAQGATACDVGNEANGAAVGATVQGSGYNQSVIIPAPSANWAAVVANSGAFFWNTNARGTGWHYKGFSIDGAGQISSTGIGAGGSALVLGQDSSMVDVGIFNWGIAVGVVAAGADGAEAVIDHCYFGQAGTTANLTFQFSVKMTHSFSNWSNSTGANLIVTSVHNTSTANTFDNPDSSDSVRLTGTGNLMSTNDEWITQSSAASGTYINLASGTSIYLEHAIIINPNGTTNVGLNVQVGGTAYLRDSQILLNANGAKALNIAGTLYDLGGNTIQTAAANTITGTVLGSGSVTGVLTTGSVGLTSGWGTSSVASAVGDAHAGRFTITGAAGAATPTLTLTFPVNSNMVPAAYLVAPASCTLFETGANDLASLTNPVSSTASTTSVVFTLTGTPVAVTYQFDYRCGP